MFAVVLEKKELQSQNVEKWMKERDKWRCHAGDIEFIHLFIPNFQFACMK